MFHDGNRELQEAFGSTALADRLVERLRRSRFSEDDKAFIESLDYFFLATASADGRPDSSFKGGAPGFVQVVAPDMLVWPDYDGNGMFKASATSVPILTSACCSSAWARSQNGCA
ncbi:MAG: pyridoxamine 5'-phosphate oxidase family protein [Alphaproteobacteria bacterium]|nr:pyridoxamine 5'-phosphate oxidase family protein [Alphaproteobacteria bacterium]